MHGTAVPWGVQTSHAQTVGTCMASGNVMVHQALSILVAYGLFRVSIGTC